jgi:hypothetical protein
MPCTSTKWALPKQWENFHSYKFEFEVHHTSVFENGITEFGALYGDCSGVPMIVFDNQPQSLVDFLNISDELKNIHFEG